MKKLMCILMVVGLYGCIGNQLGIMSKQDKEIRGASVETEIMTAIQDAIKASEFGKGNISEVGDVASPETDVDIDVAPKIEKKKLLGIF